LAKKVLVVDDNKGITDLVQVILGPPAYDCVAVNSGQDCLDLMKKQEFDLVLLDLAMPGMSGLEVLSTLSEAEIPRPHNIVIFTASPEYTEKDLQKLKEWHGRIERVTKPFTDTELLTVVEKYLRLS
jgi:twitching motility two-component system response regulator PilG